MPNEASPRTARPLATVVRAAIGAAALIVAVLVFAVLLRTRPQAPLVPVRQDALRAEVVNVRPMEIARSWTGYGAARPVHAADVSAEIAGVVVERPVSTEEGEPIRKGDLLVAIDPIDYEQRLTQAREVLVARRAELDRLAFEEQSIRDLLALAETATQTMDREIERWNDASARGAGAPAEIDRLERDLMRIRAEELGLLERLNQIPSRRASLNAQIGSDAAAVRLAEEDFRRTRIVSPIDGFIQDVHADVGERVSVGSPVARVVDLGRVETPLGLPISAAAYVRAGDHASLRADGPTGAYWTGAVSRIAPEADADTRTITVFVEITQDPSRPDAAAPLLLPGQFVRGVVESAEVESRLLVPRRAVERDRVYVADDQGLVNPVMIRVDRYIEGSFPILDPRETQWAVVARGLSPGARVVVSNLEDLKQGMLIEPVDAATLGGAEARSGAPPAAPGGSEPRP